AGGGGTVAVYPGADERASEEAGGEAGGAVGVEILVSRQGHGRVPNHAAAGAEDPRALRGREYSARAVGGCAGAGAESQGRGRGDRSEGGSASVCENRGGGTRS